ncbi:MAG: hypothetical protein ACTJGH_00340 [Peptoniphilaceae bacterium]
MSKMKFRKLTQDECLNVLSTQVSAWNRFFEDIRKKEGDNSEQSIYWKGMRDGAMSCYNVLFTGKIEEVEK